MSVIARSPDGTIRLYCKGSDAKVMKKIRADTPPELLDNTNANLHYFAKQVGTGQGGGGLGGRLAVGEQFGGWPPAFSVPQAAARRFPCSSHTHC